MPLDIKNIDKKAALPEEIEFRKELVWGKVQTRKKSKLTIFWPWVVAALVVIGFGLSFLGRVETPEIPVEENILTEKNSGYDLPKLENPTLEPQESDVIIKKSSFQAIKSNKIEIKSEVREKISDEIPIFNSAFPESLEPREIASSEQFDAPLQEEKQLSLAASRLQRSIKKMNPNVAAEQTLVAERFDLIRKLQSYPVQASSKNTSNASLNSLFNGKIHKN
ncbi:hypothetical protein SAMN04488104_100226 [Algoriphagus faecimaris]|uniref:Uncharacterized protein n=1 Tax=Algoriphagus faecimaris TaxID=686796 RepID=A0A1G6MRL5_9BACT|nr:hypothetical protein [Algoriphagus faecimaris]SDC58203.1 hypothetical protein SAMN04488104_100226 [Algoriphagus faecimaris]